MQILFVSHSWIKTFSKYGVKPNPGFVERQHNSKPRKLMLDNNSSWCLSPSSLSRCSPATWSIPPKQYPSSSPHFTLLWGSLTCSLLPPESSSNSSASFPKPPLFWPCLMFSSSLFLPRGSLYTPLHMQWILCPVSVLSLVLFPFLYYCLFPIPMIYAQWFKKKMA